jgi:hypothetical protein
MRKHVSGSDSPCGPLNGDYLRSYGWNLDFWGMGDYVWHCKDLECSAMFPDA